MIKTKTRGCGSGAVGIIQQHVANLSGRHTRGAILTANGGDYGMKKQEHEVKFRSMHEKNKPMGGGVLRSDVPAVS